MREAEAILIVLAPFDRHPNPYGPPQAGLTLTCPIDRVNTATFVAVQHFCRCFRRVTRIDSFAGGGSAMCGDAPQPLVMRMQSIGTLPEISGMRIAVLDDTSATGRYRTSAARVSPLARHGIVVGRYIQRLRMVFFSGQPRAGNVIPISGYIISMKG